MPQRRTEYVAVGTLTLDSANYRLPKDFEIDDQYALAAYLEEHYDLDEIGQSIAAEGFRPEEPLIVVEEEGVHVVVEGNRRLATVKLLTDGDYRQALPSSVRRAKWDALAEELEETVAEHDLDVAELPIVKYEDRSQVEGSLGFRHVSGIAQWSAESKARYIADLVRAGHDFSQVARMIGSRSDFVRRQYVAHRALGEAEAEGVETQAAERYFGVFYRSLSSPSSRGFIRLVDWSDFEPDGESVFLNGVERFDIFLTLVFGSEQRGLAPAITDSRQLDDLARVLADDQARDLLIAERDLPAALEVIGGDRSSVFTDLRTALGRLRRANGAAWEFAGDEELLSTATRCHDTAGRVVDQLKATPQENDQATD
jgi:hypothetical protein